MAHEWLNDFSSAHVWLPSDRKGMDISAFFVTSLAWRLLGFASTTAILCVCF